MCAANDKLREMRLLSGYLTSLRIVIPFTIVFTSLPMQRGKEHFFLLPNQVYIISAM